MKGNQNFVSFKNPIMPGKSAKKDDKLPPNQYFKSEKRSDVLSLNRQMSDLMFSTKKHTFSKLPKKTLIDKIQ